MYGVLGAGRKSIDKPLREQIPRINGNLGNERGKIVFWARDTDRN